MKVLWKNVEIKRINLETSCVKIENKCDERKRLLTTKKNLFRSDNIYPKTFYIC